MEDQRAEEAWFENEWRSGRDPSRRGGCPLMDNIQPPTSVYPSMDLYTFFDVCVAMQKQEHKKDCFFCNVEYRMGAEIYTCTYKNSGFGRCPCESCNKYISKTDAYKTIVAKVDGKETK